jgi:SpoVK/Ycf46/Vps4 family AAA+-type ATPase
MNERQQIRTWLQQGRSQKRDRSQQGYMVLFDGSSAGKLSAAQNLATQFGKEVYRVDLSRLISQYIGETEKNINNIFREAEGKSWLLYFEEADALLGKRTKVKDSHDRYANRQIKYLLDKLQAYPGLVILSSNLKQTLIVHLHGDFEWSVSPKINKQVLHLPYVPIKCREAVAFPTPALLYRLQH